MNILAFLLSSGAFGEEAALMEFNVQLNKRQSADIHATLNFTCNLRTVVNPPQPYRGGSVGLWLLLVELSDELS